MIRSTTLFAAGAFLLSAAVAHATPRESVTYLDVPSNGIPGSAANAVRTHTFAGGYALGRITLAGSLTSVRPSTWMSDARIDITAPDGSTTLYRPFLDGTTYSEVFFSGQVVLPPGTNPAGLWTFRFSEAIDDGGTANVDALCDVTITLTDEPPQPPPSTHLGQIGPAGLVVTGEPIIGGSSVRWYRFSVAQPAQVERASYLDIDMFGSTTNAPPDRPQNDTAMALYDAAGNLVAFDNDSGAGFTSQFSFGTGTRPPSGNGAPYAGQNGALASGTYYLAVGGSTLVPLPTLWSVRPLANFNTTPVIRFASNLGTATLCPQILAQPASVVANAGDPASFTVVTTLDAPLTYEWRRGTTPLANGPNISGAATTTLTILSVSAADAGLYSVVVSNSCGAVTSDGALLTVGASCDPDYTCDGNADQDDVACLIDEAAGNPGCGCQDPDFNRDGNVDQDDVAALINVVAGGNCP